jgi:hypothetical protein
MLIQVNTDHNITGEAALIAEVETAVEQTLGRFGDRITRVEVHLSDENSDKKSGAEDMRCLLEARLVGLQPISLSHRAATVMQAVEGAAEQMERSLDSTLGRLGHH